MRTEIPDLGFYDAGDQVMLSSAGVAAKVDTGGSVAISSTSHGLSIDGPRSELEADSRPGGSLKSRLHTLTSHDDLGYQCANAWAPSSAFSKLGNR